MRYLNLHEVLDLHRRVIEQSGGEFGIHDLGALQSALAQPHMTFDDVDLYPSFIEKASAFGYSLVMNHPFVEANERSGPAALETLLVLNGFEIDAEADEQERVFLQLSSGRLARDEFTDWLRTHIKGRAEA